MKIAVFFPGMGYHCDKPLLYYSRQLIKTMGYDTILQISFEGCGRFKPGDLQAMEAFGASALRCAEAQLHEVIWEEYEEVLFISKSIGTVIASAYARNHKVSCKQVLFTPLEYTFRFKPCNAIAFTGTKDPWVNHDEICGLCREAGIPLEIYENTNHSLEAADSMLPGGPAHNLEIQTDVLGKVATFLS